jgi:hypothetical protein
MPSKYRSLQRDTFGSYQISMTLLDDTLLHTTLSRKNKLPCQKAKSPPQPPVRNIILENNIYEEKKKHNTLPTLPPPSQTTDISSSNPPLRHPTPYDT